MDTSGKASSSGLLGKHPRALPFILLCQSGFAFSITGMQSIGILFMGTYLFQPGHINHILGFGPIRAVLVQIGGSDEPVGLASVVFGLAGACAYLTPLIGGFISDRVMTRSQAVMLGAVCCAAGQLLIAAETTFLVGLAVLLAGIGLVGVNIATQLGDLYATTRADLANAFQAINICNNLAGVGGVLVCGGLGQGIAWRWGYVAAACGMLLGVGAYAAGRRSLPIEPPRMAVGRTARSSLARADSRTVVLLLTLLPGLLLAGLANGQIPNAYLVWGDAVYRRQAFGHTIPSSWLVAFDSGFSVVASIAVLAFWQFWTRRRALPNDLTRIAIGALIAAAAPLVLATASAASAATGRRVSLGWAVGFHMLDNLGMAMVGPVASAVFARLAPRAVAALMMGVLNADAFGSALAVGLLGTMLPRLGGTRFWLLQAGLVAGGGLFLVLLRLGTGKRFSPEIAADHRLRADAETDQPRAR